MLTLSSEAPSRCILAEEARLSASLTSAIPALIRTWPGGVLGGLTFLESNNIKVQAFAKFI
jgi:hypothetical protein